MCKIDGKCDLDTTPILFIGICVVDWLDDGSWAGVCVSSPANGGACLRGRANKTELCNLCVSDPSRRERRCRGVYATVLILRVIFS